MTRTSSVPSWILAAFLVAVLFQTDVRAKAPDSPSSLEAEIVPPIELGRGEAGSDATDAQTEAVDLGEPTGLRRGAQAQVEEIVVQARKRDEFLEDTPVSVTALGEDTLREHGVTRIDQIQQLVPNLVFQTGANGAASNIKIRGVGTSTAAIAFDPGVGIYVDGVFLPRAFGSLVDIVDVQQIEVLRGPQGTLFGKNTVGGAINVTSVKPHEDLEAFAMVQAGNYGFVSTRAMVNIPVVEERVFARFSLTSTNDSGYFQNTLRDETWNNRNSLAFLGTIRAHPTEETTFDISGTWSRDHNAGRGAQCRVVQETTLGSPPLAPSSFYDACRRTMPLRNTANVAQLTDIEGYGLWGIGAWDLGDLAVLEDLSLKSLTSWRQQRPRVRLDTDSTEFAIVQVSRTAGGLLDGGDGFAQQISQEFQMNGSAWEGRINYVGGYFVFWETGTDTSTNYTLPPQDGSIGLNRLATTDTSIDNWTWAIYMQATADLTDYVSVTGGVRYTEDKKGLSLFQFDPREPEAVLSDEANSAIFTNWSPMGSLAISAPEDLIWEIGLDHLMGYFTYSRGFKGGGFNGVPGPVTGELEAFGPETLDNFEVGFKTIGWDQRLTFNVALFLGEYDDIQVTTIRDLGLDDNGAPQIARLTLNAASATTKGLEIETLVRPWEGVQVNGSVGLVDATYDNFEGLSDLTGRPLDRSGESFNSVPKLQTFLAVQYSLPVDAGQTPWMHGWLTPRLEWAYQSSVHYLGPEVAEATQHGFNMINARLSYDFLDDRAQVALWGRNLLDVRTFDQAIPIASTFGTVSRYYQPPLTFGGELSYRFE